MVSESSSDEADATPQLRPAGAVFTLCFASVWMSGCCFCFVTGLLPFVAWMKGIGVTAEPATCHVEKVGVETNCGSGWGCRSFGSRSFSSLEETKCPGPFPGRRLEEGRRLVATCACYYIPWVLLTVDGSTSGPRCAYLHGDGGGQMTGSWWPAEREKEAHAFLEKFQDSEVNGTGTECWLWDDAVTLQADASPPYPGFLSMLLLFVQGGLMCLVCFLVVVGLCSAGVPDARQSDEDDRSLLAA
eukprot:TRINITY_DN9591_c3_g1_i1.p1 TRINITY_DN9591_c3_g1~~TRINITY_DN9591_c3_g1_i1.p1  ORF type:complete len:244 (-),score=25.74 TRINITY_DN9591_c3_g1_i1:287-1018(-)